MKLITINPDRKSLMFGVKTFRPGDILPVYVLAKIEKLPSDQKKDYYKRNLISMEDYEKLLKAAKESNDAQNNSDRDFNLNQDDKPVA